MSVQTASTEPTPKPRVLAQAPEELTNGRLQRLGEGVGKVVYASEHWVVKRKRSPSEIVALIALWKLLRKFECWLPFGLGVKWLERPSRQIRCLRVMLQGIVLIVPRSVWFTSHIGEVWRVYRKRDRRGEKLARVYLAGTPLVPERITFPPARIKVGAWPGWLMASEAIERVDETLYRRLRTLAGTGRFAELEGWLNRFLDTRQAGWQRGIFSLDAHLKNFGVCGDRVVLLDTGGLTDDWSEIEQHLALEDVVTEPHIQLGLGPLLGSRPDIADRFNKRWKAAVNPSAVRERWPADPDNGREL
ncbi:MAG: hypothetical protein LC130_21535 [Bryobacterales bacterium]|nr:hypothetical protein [Bryobacterales bacterium]